MAFTGVVNGLLVTGNTVLHATLYAARRRVVPILITSLTTIASLFSLAIGLGGHSLLWGLVATAPATAHRRNRHPLVAVHP